MKQQQFVSRSLIALVVGVVPALAACGADNGSQGWSEHSRQTSSSLSAGGSVSGPAGLFPSDSVWYKDVSNEAVAPESASLVSNLAWGAGGTFKIDFSITYMHANGATPVSVPLDSSYDPDNDHAAVPVPAGGSVEGNPGYSCDDGGDCHLIVIDDANKKLFELWQASQSADGTWSGTQETVWDLTQHYGPTGRGLGCTSADAAGFPIMAGLIGVNETAAGEINHAIRYILPNNRILKNGYVAPATHSTGAYSGQIPMGTRLRLKPSFDETQLRSKGAQVVARALKKYGMMLADAGQIALTAESDQLESTKWDGLLGPDDLTAIAPSDFEVVDFGSVHQGSMDCARQ